MLLGVLSVVAVLNGYDLDVSDFSVIFSDVFSSFSRRFLRCSNAVSGAEYVGGDERLRLGRFGVVEVMVFEAFAS